LQKQTLFAASEQTNPHKLKIVSETVSATLRAIRCLGCDCRGDIAAITLHAAETAFNF
jgi:hypothetical protein